MGKEKSIFYLEFKKFVIRRNIFILAVIFVLLMLLVQVEMIEYNDSIKNIEFSSDLEQLKAKQFDRYSPYGVYGIQLTAIPSPMKFISTLDLYSSLSASVDSGTKLKIYETKKDKPIFAHLINKNLIFSGLLFLFGSLLSSIYGLDAYKNEKYLKSICTIKSFRKVFFGILLARVVFISLFLVFVFVCTALLGWANGVWIIDKYYALYALVTILVMNFFLFFGASLGAMKKRKTGMKIFVGGLVALNIIAPLAIALVINGLADGISELQAEYDKLKILTTFEKRGIKKFGTDRTGEKSKSFARSYLDNELKLTEDRERKLKQEIIKNIRRYQAFSSILPSTFYVVSASEISGWGFNNFITFYDFAEKKKRGFIEFYADKKFGLSPKSGKVESYIKNDEHILYAKSSLPVYFGFGIAFTILYTIGLGILTYRNAYKKVYTPKQKLDGENGLYVNIKNKETNFLFTRVPLLKDKVYNSLSGKEKLKAEIYISTGRLERVHNTDFTYLVNSLYFEDIKPGPLHRFLFGKPLTENMDNWEILLEYALQRKLVVMDGFLDGIDPEKVNDVKLRIKEQKVYCLILSPDYYFTSSVTDSPDNVYYFKNEPAAEIMKNELAKRFPNYRDHRPPAGHPGKNNKNSVFIKPPGTDNGVEN